MGDEGRKNRDWGEDAGLRTLPSAAVRVVQYTYVHMIPHIRSHRSKKAILPKHVIPERELSMLLFSIHIK